MRRYDNGKLQAHETNKEDAGSGGEILVGVGVRTENGGEGLGRG